MTFEYWDIYTSEGLYHWDLQERYDEWLDELYPELYVAGFRQTTSVALAELDPTAYRCGYLDWLDGELGETITDEAPVEGDN